MYIILYKYLLHLAGVRVLSPMSGFPVSWSGLRRRNSQSVWLCRPEVPDYRSATGLGETETPLSEGAYKVSCTLGPRTKAVTP